MFEYTDQNSPMLSRIHQLRVRRREDAHVAEIFTDNRARLDGGRVLPPGPRWRHRERGRCRCVARPR
jgi:hypothetical protein